MPEKVLLRARRSRFVQIFRTTPAATVCPNFFVLAHANGCAFSPHCRYCYLKSSFRHLGKTHVFDNLERLLAEVRAWIRRPRLESYVLNTGNLSDSLSLESFRPLMRHLVELFRAEAEAKGRRHTLLLVSKGGRRESAALLRARPCANVIVSFSVNNPRAAARYEPGAPSVVERMRAARELKRKGWRLRMRIDPMILPYTYAGVARQVRALAPERVTLGSLRAEPGLENYTEPGLFMGLEPPARTGFALARYPRKERLALYRQAIDILRDTCPIGLCEETRDIWKALRLRPAKEECNCGF